MLRRRAVLALLSHPPSWLALAISVAAPWGFIEWFRPGLPMAAAAIALSAVLLLLWPVLLARDPAFAERIAPAPSELDVQGEARVRRLEDDLQRLGSAQGVEQLRLLRQKFDRLVAVLRHRLDEGEVTYGRYLGSAEQVYLSALDNLHDVVVALTSLSGMDAGYLDKRVRDIERDGVTEAERAELETIHQRRALIKQQQETIEQLFGENEKALAVLANTTAALAGTRTRSGHAAVPAEDAIRELETLAGRTGRYASKP